MRAGLLLRLSKLELRRSEAGQIVHRHTIRTPWDGSAELPQDLPDSGMLRIAVLPTKAPSAAAWAEKVLQHWPRREA